MSSRATHKPVKRVSRRQTAHLCASTQPLLRLFDINCEQDPGIKSATSCRPSAIMLDDQSQIVRLDVRYYLSHAESFEFVIGPAIIMRTAQFIDVNALVQAFIAVVAGAVELMDNILHKLQTNIFESHIKDIEVTLTTASPLAWRTCLTLQSSPADKLTKLTPRGPTVNTLTLKARILARIQSESPLALDATGRRRGELQPTEAAAVQRATT